MPIPIVSLDSESYYDDEVSVKPLGYYKYARHPRADLYMVSVCDGSECWAGHPRDFNWEALNGVVLLNHNKAHDEEMIIAGQERGDIPKFTPAEWHCTANFSSYCWNQRSLAGAMMDGFGIEVDKGVRDKAKGKTWQQMVEEGWSEDMLRYARHDAQYPHMMWTKYSHLWPEWERRLSNLTISQGRYGVAIDVVRLAHYIEVLNKIIFTATNNLPWISRGRKPGSPIGIAEECRSSGIPGQPVKADDEEAAEEWEETYAPRFPWVMALRNLRKAKKTLAFLETMQLRIRPDNTVAFSLKYWGAHTGRFSGDAGMSFHNLPKSPFFVRSDYTFELNKKILAAHDELFDAGKTPEGIVEILDLRGLIIARPGMKLAPTDLSQIEPRVLNYTAGNLDILAEVAKGMAIYESHARRTMGWTGGNLKKENKPKYALAKVRVLSFGFGAGWEKAIVSAQREKVDLTERDDECALQASVDGKFYYRVRDNTTQKWVYNGKPDSSNVVVAPLVNEKDFNIEGAEKVVFIEKTHYRTGVKYLEAQTVYGQQARAEIKDFRSSNALITAQWDTLNEMLRSAIGSDLELELPSGRSMKYRDVRLSKRKVKNKETNEYEERTVITVKIGGKRVVTYGSKLCENITQAIARDIFAHNMLLCEAAGIRTLFSVHDEIVPEVPENFDSSIITKIMSTTPAWVPGLPVGAETKDSKRYIK